MKNDINEEALLSILNSEDNEIRTIGVNFIKANYKIPETIYLNDTVPICFSCVRTESFYLEESSYRLLHYIQDLPWCLEWVKAFLKAISDYTEAYEYTYN